MAKISTPYVILRERRGADGTLSWRPRFEPSARERALGFKPRDLKHDDGRWFTVGEAAAWAAENAQAIRAARRNAEAARPAPPKFVRTVGDLITDFLGPLDLPFDAAVKRASDRFRDALKPNTQRSHRKAARALRWRYQTPAERKAGKPLETEVMWDAPVHLVEAADMSDFALAMKKERGVAMSRAAMMVASSAFAWGRTSTRWRLKDNPCLKLKLEKAKGRKVTWSPAVIKAMLAACAVPSIAFGEPEPEIADAIWTGLVTGANPIDVLHLQAGAWNGRCIFERSKTGVRISVKLDLMEATLAGADERRKAKGWDAPELIVDHRTGRAFNEHTFRHRFAAVRALCVAGSAEHGLSPCPAAAAVRFQDLRDTHFTWSYTSGNRLEEVAHITGHKEGSVAQMAQDHYLDLNEEAADRAMDNFAAHLKAVMG